MLFGISQEIKCLTVWSSARYSVGSSAGRRVVPGGCPHG
jgi:hypothetical protein